MVLKKNNQKSKFSIWIVTITILLNFCAFSAPLTITATSYQHKVQTEFFENRNARITINQHTLLVVKHNAFTNFKEKLNLYQLLSYNALIKAKLIKYNKKVLFFKIPYTLQNKIISFSDSNADEPLFFNS